MTRGLKRAAFTLIELLVVVAIIALLLSILLPSLSSAREQGKRAKCLSNLKSLGTAMYQYANDDSAEQIIPISLQMIQNATALGGGAGDNGYWLTREINWFTWGGRSGQKAFKTAAAKGYALADVMPQDPSGGTMLLRPDYAADRRPLNLYMITGVSAGDKNRMEWFQCPGDTGYPDDPKIDDSPPFQALRSCYDTMGSSYRGSLANYSTSTGGGLSPSSGSFSFGVWGHRMSSMIDTGKITMVGEPTFFNMIGQDDPTADTSQDVPVYGWHKRKETDNVLFCDGSARSTRAEKPVQPTDELANDVTDASLVMHRGTTYRLDIYPIGGAIIWGDWTQWIQQNKDRWPAKNFQDNLRK